MSRIDSHPSPPPGRIRKSKYMDYRKNVEEIKADTKQKRVFGTQRNTNVLVKSKTEKKTTGKSKVETEVKQPKLKGFKAEEIENDEVAKPGTDERDEGLKKDEVAEKAAEEKSSEEIEMESQKKKSIGFQEKLDEMISAPRTPVQLSSSLRKPRRSGTPYHTAQNCRRCRNDKMESSSYWIEQIKLAESVGKHFASIMFFQVAHKCNAEPARSLKIELKRYLSRHGHLVRQKEWIEASRNYGLPVPKDDHNLSGEREDFKDQINQEDD
ncbi:hypothetical protein QQ045_012816 [Rhodiola kirilowii]